MNKINTDIPNKIKQPSKCCVYCGKSYVKKTNLDKHIILCELINGGSKKSYSIDDEETDIPSQKKLYKMLLELGSRFSKIEEKVDELNKWVVKKKKKVNVVEWLNNNIKPNIIFDKLTEKISVTEDDILYLFEHNFYDTLNYIFDKNIYSPITENDFPVFTFIQKNNVFYIYQDDDVKWIELSRDNLIKFLNKVYMKLFRLYSEYKKNHSERIQNDEAFSILCDKVSVKLLNIDFRVDSVLGKIKSNMYSRMKTDMKAFIEFEFEF